MRIGYKKMKKAVVLLSGGLDSTTCLAIAKNMGFEIYALSFRYGQRHNSEVDAARRIAANADVARHVIADIDLKMVELARREFPFLSDRRTDLYGKILAHYEAD